MLLCRSLPPPADRRVTTNRHRADSPLCGMAAYRHPLQSQPNPLSQVVVFQRYTSKSTAPNPLWLSCLFSVVYRQKEAFFSKKGNGPVVCPLQFQDRFSPQNGRLAQTKPECRRKQEAYEDISPLCKCFAVPGTPARDRAIDRAGHSGFDVRSSFRVKIVCAVAVAPVPSPAVFGRGPSHRCSVALRTTSREAKREGGKAGQTQLGRCGVHPTSREIRVRSMRGQSSSRGANPQL